MSIIMDSMKETDNDGELKIINYFGENKENYTTYRGCVMSVKDNSLVCPSFGHTIEYDNESEDCVFENFKWFYSSEGTFCRLYYFNDKWYLSTHKKLSAFDSRWSSKYSFGEIFQFYLKEMFPNNSYEEFCDSLDKSVIYYFFLRSNNQNRIICHVSNLEINKKCIFVGVRKDEKFDLHEKFEDNEFLKHFTRLTPLENASKDNYKEIVEKIDPFKYQGIIGFQLYDDDSKIKVVKILNKEYKNWISVRGNNPNIKFRYLEIRQDKEMVENLYKLYPKYSNTFDEFEMILMKISRKIYRAYIDRYIRKKYVTLPKYEYMVMKQCHEWYLENKNENKIFARKVKDIMDKLSPVELYRMLSQFKFEEKHKKESSGESKGFEMFTCLGENV